MRGYGSAYFCPYSGADDSSHRGTNCFTHRRSYGDADSSAHCCAHPLTDALSYARAFLRPHPQLLHRRRRHLLPDWRCHGGLHLWLHDRV